MEQLTNPLPSGCKVIIDRLGIISGGKILDVGTGDGNFIRVLMKSFHDFESFVGIDLSPKGLRKARKTFRKDQAQFFEMNAEELHFDDNSFDTVCMRNSLHHLENPSKALAEMKRVLKPNGLLILEECIGDQDQSPAQFSDVLIHSLEAETDCLVGIYHRQPYLRKELKQLIESLGFQKSEFFPSPYQVECVLCKSFNSCAGEVTSEKNIKDGIRDIRSALKKIKKRPEFQAQFEKYAAQAKILEKRVREIGFTSASASYFIISKK